MSKIFKVPTVSGNIGATIAPSEIMSRSAYFDRRRFIGAVASLSSGATSLFFPETHASNVDTASLIARATKSALSTNEPVTPSKDAIAKTRFRELEDDISKNADGLITSPWKVSVEGACAKPRVFDIDDLWKLAPLEERIYRMRCTEGWSHVIPYLGYPLSALLKLVEPTGNAKFVAFTSIHAPDKLTGQRNVTYIPWPYVEGLRMDEAMHPLTLVALGAYGEKLPKPLGAPLAIRVPWKYGIKSPKAVVRIRLVEQQPISVWNKTYPQYHSFWSNVNPDTAPGFFDNRSQERRTGDLLRRATLPFNGYGEQVAALYSSMDRKLTY